MNNLFKAMTSKHLAVHLSRSLVTHIKFKVTNVCVNEYLLKFSTKVNFDLKNKNIQEI